MDTMPKSNSPTNAADPDPDEDLARLRADAARYRWLRSGQRKRQGTAMPDVGGRTVPLNELRILLEFNFWCSPERLDAAIDARLAAQGCEVPRE